MLRTPNTNFTLMVAGYRGLGKSSFLNTLFDQNITSEEYKKDDGSLNIYVLNVKSEGISRGVTIIDTPGFGNTMNNTEISRNIKNYIRSQFDSFLTEETKIRRSKNFEDNRVHCLLYFISPNPNGLSANDIAFLKSVDTIVNIVPVIGKSDALTKKELFDLRRNFSRQLSKYNISVFDFEKDTQDRDLLLNRNINEKIPFSIINLDRVNSLENFKGRKMPWGSININDLNHCDFRLLKEILLSNYTDAFIEKTANCLYEEYRALVLPQILPDTFRIK